MKKACGTYRYIIDSPVLDTATYNWKPIYRGTGTLVGEAKNGTRYQGPCKKVSGYSTTPIKRNGRQIMELRKRGQLWTESYVVEQSVEIKGTGTVPYRTVRYLCNKNKKFTVIPTLKMFSVFRIRILLFSSEAFKMPTKKVFS